METAKILRQTTTTIMIEIHAATLMSRAPSQNWITIAAAEISAQRVMAELYQFYRPRVLAGAVDF
jgi:hypothetical protein